MSGQVDADADGVILLIQNQEAAVRVYGVRELTSGDITLSTRNRRSRMHVVGLDAAKKFEAYLEAASTIKIYLVGQTKGSVVYYTNNVAVTDPTTGSWQTRDADNYGVAGEANGLFLSVWNIGTVTDISFQHGDSSDNYSVRKLNGDQGFQAAAGLNAANLWGEYMGNTSVDVYIAAYTIAVGNWMATGTYTGNGTGQSITDVGFQPDVVIVKRYPSVKGQIRTSTMPAGMTKEIKTSALVADRITALDSTGFTVGTHASVNTLNDPYYWIAFKATTGVCEVSSYTGNPPSQTVSVAFQPNYVIVVPESSSESVHRSSAVAGDNTFSFEFGGLATSQITALVATGFDVGNSASVNSNGAIYHYVAFKVSSGQVAVNSYQGDGSVGRAISVGFQPEWVMIAADTSVEIADGSPGVIHRPASMTGDVSLNIGWAYGTTVFDNCITALTSTGFEVGSDNVVNQGPAGSGPMYYWMAFGDGVGGGGGGGGGAPKIVSWREVNPN